MAFLCPPGKHTATVVQLPDFFIYTNNPVMEKNLQNPELLSAPGLSVSKPAFLAITTLPIYVSIPTIWDTRGEKTR